MDVGDWDDDIVRVIFVVSHVAEHLGLPRHRCWDGEILAVLRPQQDRHLAIIAFHLINLMLQMMDWFGLESIAQTL